MDANKTSIRPLITISQADVALDQVDDDQDGSAAEVLGDLLDKRGAWNWGDDSEHDPVDRLAIIESSGAWWCVYRGSESDDAWRFSSREEAIAKFRDMISQAE